MERQQYLKFFTQNNKKLTSKTIHNHQNTQKQSLSHHITTSKSRKLLPHISQQFNYKLINQLLVNKIMHPRRDKLIIQNFQKPLSRSTTKQDLSKSQHKISRSLHHAISLDIQRMSDADFVAPSTNLHSTVRIRRNLSKHKSKGEKQSEKSFNLALENQRMGKRIINTKSSVGEILKKTFHTYKNSDKILEQQKQNCQSNLKNSYLKGRQNNKIYLSGKINNGVKVFFNPVEDDNIQANKSKTQIKSRSMSKNQQPTISEENQSTENINFSNSQKTKTNKQYRHRFLRSQDSQVSNHVETHFPESFKVFGRGPTILMIHDLEITCNPPLKQDSMLILELITHEKRVNIHQNKQKSIRTPPISYDFMRPSKDHSSSSNCLRFAINVSQIGDFVPFRIFRVYGVQIQQMGIIDIDLAPFRYRRSEMAQENNDTFARQFKLSKKGHKMERDIISCRASAKLRKLKLNKPVDIAVNMNYKIYSKKYKPMVDKESS